MYSLELRIRFPIDVRVGPLSYTYVNSSHEARSDRSELRSRNRFPTGTDQTYIDEAVAVVQSVRMGITSLPFVAWPATRRRASGESPDIATPAYQPLKSNVETLWDPHAVVLELVHLAVQTVTRGWRCNASDSESVVTVALADRIELRLGRPGLIGQRKRFTGRCRISRANACSSPSNRSSRTSSSCSRSERQLRTVTAPIAGIGDHDVSRSTI